MTISKFYYYLFYRIYYFSIKISDDFLNEIKPIVAISVSEIFLLLQVFIWYSIAMNRFIEISNEKPFLISIALVITFFNYFTFLYRNKWKKYNKEFAAISKKNFFWGGCFILLILIIALGELVFAFSELFKHRNVMKLHSV